jgi:Domain of unknown function (DUF6134)
MTLFRWAGAICYFYLMMNFANHYFGLKKLLLSVFLLSIFTFSVQLKAQVLKYEISASGVVIGQLTVSKTKIDNQVVYTAKSESVVHFFGKINVSYALSSVFKNGLLQNATVLTYTNGKLHNKTLTAYNSGNYEIKKDNKVFSLKENVHFSGVMLYFNEPSDQMKVYSEIHGVINMIEQIDTGQYKIVDAETNRSSYYTYSDGKLEEIVIEHALLNFKLKRI